MILEVILDHEWVKSVYHMWKLLDKIGSTSFLQLKTCGGKYGWLNGQEMQEPEEIYVIWCLFGVVDGGAGELICTSVGSTTSNMNLTEMS